MSPIASYFLLTAIVVSLFGLASFAVGLCVGRQLWKSHRSQAVQLQCEIGRLRARLRESPSPQK